MAIIRSDIQLKRILKKLRIKKKKTCSHKWMF